MSDLDIQTILVVLAGVTIFLAVIMAGFGTQRVHPGFGLWILCQAFIAIACVLLADRERLPESVLALVVPGMMVGGVTLRVEGLRLFLGRKTFDYRSLAVPAAALVLLASFTFAVDSPTGRILVTTVAVALLSWAMATLLVSRAKGRDKHSYRVFGAVFGAYGAFLVACGIAWTAGSDGWSDTSIGWADLFLYILIMLFEITWVVIFLSMTTGRTAEALEAAHRAAELRRDQLADLLAFLPDATFAVDSRRNVIAWNRAIEGLTGVSAGEVVGRPFEERARTALGDRVEMLIDLVLDPDKRSVSPLFRDIRREEQGVSAETEIEFPANPGTSRHLWLAVTVLRDAHGEVTGAIESMRDVSVRENAERVIRQREEQFRKLFELNLDGILAVAPDGAIQDANPAACEMLGMTKEEICAVGPAGIIQMDEDAIDRFEKGPPSERVLTEFTYVRKDGSTFPGEWMSVAYCDALGSPRGFVVFRDIAERREAQKVLRQSEAGLLQAQAATHVGNWEIDLDARSVWMSPEALRIHGLPQTTSYFALGTNEFTQLAEDPAAVREQLERVIREGGICDFEYGIRRHDDGAARTLWLKGEVATDASGRLSKLTGVMQDVTELKRVQEALGAAQRTPDDSGRYVFWIDSQGRIAFLNDSMCGRLGYTRAELLDMTLDDIVCETPGARPFDGAEIWEEVKRQGSVSFRAAFRRKDDVEIPVKVDIGYTGCDGREYGFVIARDSARRDDVEEALRYETVSEDQTADEILWLDAEGRFVYVSESACEHLGYTCDELLRMTIYDVAPMLSKAWREMWEKVKRRGSVTQEAVHRTKEGRDIPVEVTSSYIEHDGREYNLLCARETGGQTHTGDTLSQDEDRVLQTLTMEAIGRLAGGIAHDFNNLLTAIMGYGSLVLADKKVQELSVRKDVEEIRSAAERASALTQKVLSFSRRQALQPRVVSLNRILSDMDSRLRGVLGGDIEIANMYSPDVGFIEVDPVQFEEMVLNLATNARDAMPEGGRFILETRRSDVSEDYRELYPDLQPGNYVLLSVSDTGVGMSPDVLAHIFEPFFTTKPSGVGAGLGLSMVYGFVRQSGGFVNVYSEVDKGTTLKVYLPRVPEPAREAIEEPRAGSQKALGGVETILVVEDEAPLRRLVARVLGGLGYQVFVAGSGPEAVELLDDLEEPPGLLLTDVVLPGGMQGNDVAAAFLARLPELPVLYMSGHARDAIVHSGRLDEGVNFLSKPFTPETLAAKVREVLDAEGDGRSEHTTPADMKPD